ncbi:hypothetical protein [Nostoc sp. 106C]|nr:hypothetical protein [Nostoc sp. 106C]
MDTRVIPNGAKRNVGEAFPKDSNRKGWDCYPSGRLSANAPFYYARNDFK